MTKKPYRFGKTFILNHAPKLLAKVKLVTVAGHSFKMRKNSHDEYQSLAFMKGIK
jgi:hypothetical protein